MIWFNIGMSRYDLTDFEWRAVEPVLPNKRWDVPRVDDSPVLNGIFWVLRSGALGRRERNLIERFFSKLKHVRRVATRYDKLVANFLAMVSCHQRRGDYGFP